MHSSSNYQIEVFDNQEQEKLISEDLCEIFTIFRYISNNLNYNRACLSNLKILEVGCGAGENLILALNHGAKFVAGIDVSESLIKSAALNFTKSRVDDSKYFFTKTNVFSHRLCEIQLPSQTYENYFDKVMSCWVVPQARSLSEVKELLTICKKYVKYNGDIVFLTINPKIIENFPAVKSLPRIENFRLVDVFEEGDHFVMRSEILEPFSEEVIMEVSHNVFSVEELTGVINELELVLKHSGPLEMMPKDDDLSYPFEMISNEISREYTMGYYFHLKKPASVIHN